MCLRWTISWIRNGTVSNTCSPRFAELKRAYVRPHVLGSIWSGPSAYPARNSHSTYTVRTPTSAELHSAETIRRRHLRHNMQFIHVAYTVSSLTNTSSLTISECKCAPVPPLAPVFLWLEGRSESDRPIDDYECHSTPTSNAHVADILVNALEF